MQEGVKYSLMSEPIVSGPQSYKELCTAAKNKEMRLAGLQKREQYETFRLVNELTNPSQQEIE